MLTRLNGLALTTADAAVAAAVDGLEGALLRYGKDVAGYLTGPGPASDSAYAVAAAAAIHLFALTAPAAARARPLVAAAERQAAAATPHEQLFVGAIGAWARGNIRGAIARHMIIAERWPHDLLSAKILHFHQINTGDFTGMLESLVPIVAAQTERGFVHGMHAFALEQCGDARAAERAGRRAAETGFDPWAHHAVAHVLDTEGRAAEGRDWMTRHSADWDSCSSFMLTHNWWHAALFEITLGDHDAALALYDRRVWGVRRDSAQDQVNAVSLLARLEILGVDAGGRWHDLAPHLAQRIDDRANAFFDLHYAYGLARAGADDRLAPLLAAIDARALAGDPSHAMTAQAMHGMVAHARRRYADAAARLGSLGDCTRFGGSHTQRRLIALVAADAGRRAADWGRVIAGPWRQRDAETARFACAI